MHISTTSTDGTVCAVTMTGDAVSELVMTLAGAAISTVAPAGALPSAIGDRHPPTRHRFHLAHFHRGAPIRGATAGSWR